MAISTTIGMALLPFLVTESLGLSFLVLGILEGATEFLSSVLRLANGVLFDKVKNKRWIFVFATALALVAKMLLLLPSAVTVFCSKIFERMSNGAFASPRDAYVAEMSKNRGMALGMLAMSKSAGCILGPILVSVTTIFFGNLEHNLMSLIGICCLMVVPAFLLSFRLNVREIERTNFSWQEIASISKGIAPILVVAFLFFLGRFNDGLLALYLKQNGFPEWFYLATISIFNGIMLVTSPFIGKEIDQGRVSRAFHLSIGSLAVFGFCFFMITKLAWVWAVLGLIAWGVQRTGAVIVFSSLIFKNVSKANFGTAIGIFHLVSGFGTMITAVFCGWLAKYNFAAVFAVSFIFSIASLLLARRSCLGMIPATK